MKKIESIKSDLYIKTLLKMCILLCVPFLCMWILYTVCARTLEDQKENEMLKLVEDCTEKFESEMQDAYSLAQSLANDVQILQYISFFDKGDNNNDIIRMIEAQKTLRTLASMKENLALIQIYANDSESIIDQGCMGEYLDRYYHHFSVSGMNYDQWCEFLAQATTTHKMFYDMEYTYNKASHEAWMLSYRVPNKKTLKKYGQIFIYVDKASLLKDVSALDYLHEGYLAVINDEQEIILLDNASNKSRDAIRKDVASVEVFDRALIVKEEGTKMLLIKHYSDKLQATVAMAVPRDYIYLPIESIRMLLYAIMFLFLVCSFFLIVLLAFELTQPYMEMKWLLNKENSSPTDLIGEIGSLLEYNKTLKNEVMNSIPALKMASINNLLLAGFESDEDMDKAITHIGIDRNAKQYGLLIIKLFDLRNNSKKDVKEISMQQAFFGKLMESEFQEVQGIYYPDHERLVVLLAMNKEDTTDAEKVISNHLEKMLNPFFKNNKLEMIISGDVSDKINDFSGMFLRAQSVLPEKSINNMEGIQKIFWYSQEKDQYLKYYYTPEVKKRFSAVMIMGNERALIDVFEDLKSANARIFEQKASEEICKLLQELFDTLCEIQKEYRIHETDKLKKLKLKIKEKLASGEDLMQTFYLLEDAFYTCINISGDVKREQNKNLSEKIHLYICNNYRDPQICLSSIAEHFSITESYLARLYKQSYQITCNKAIEALRMEDAAQQLARGKSVVQVAESVGYNSAQVFRRVYKKYYQELPSKSKESLK